MDWKAFPLLTAYTKRDGRDAAGSIAVGGRHLEVCGWAAVPGEAVWPLSPPAGGTQGWSLSHLVIPEAG